MLTRNFPCKKGIQLIDDMTSRRVSYPLTIGCVNHRENAVYLYFELQDFSSMSRVDRVRLVLYHMRNNTVQEENVCIRVSAASNYVNPYTFYSIEDICMAGYQYDYYVPTDSYITVLDITTLVQNWCSMAIENNGLIIQLQNTYGNMFFAGVEDSFAAPFMEIRYDITGEVPPVYVSPTLPLSATAIIEGEENG